MKSSLYYKIVLLFYQFTFCIALAMGQQIPLQPDLTEGTNFLTLQKETNSFFEENPKVKGYKQWKRKEWFLEPRLFPSGKMENLTLKTWKAYERFKKTLPDSRSTHGSWTFLGPTSNPIGMGRLNSITFNPNNNNIIYVGGSNSGVWKSGNGGTSWTNITPHIPLLAVADIELDPGNANVIYLLTGDGNPAPFEWEIHAQTEISSIGILRSPDGGINWYPTGFSFGHPSVVFPTKLLIHPTDVNTQFVACNQGIYMTTDHWEHDTLVWGSVIYDIEFKPGNPEIMYASGENQIIRSINGGDTWNIVTDGDFSFDTTVRIELAVAPSAANIVYAMSGTPIAGYNELLQSTSSGVSNTWTSQNTTATTMGAQPWYNMGLAVDPTDHTDVFGGMQWINRSFDSGVSWTSIVGIVHADIHEVVYVNGTLWVVCDGGIYRSIDEGTNWFNMTNGMAITEIYRISGTPQNTNLYYAGCQDNGTMRRNGPTSAFDEALGADGMTSMIDYTNSNIVYASWQGGGFAKSVTGGGNGSFTELNIPGGGGNWITPAVMDPLDPLVLFVGKTSIMRSFDGGASWDSIGNLTGTPLNCLAQGTNNRQYLYASQADQIYRTSNAQVPNGMATWVNVGTEVPNLFITGITVDPTNAQNAFVSLSGYSDGLKVFETTDAGINWENISGNLPNVPVNCIRYDVNASGTDALYIGTDIGVFYRDDNLGEWIYFSNFLPAVNISDLYINHTDNTVVAGTYGRGLWRSSKYDGCVANIFITNNTGAPLGGVKSYSATNLIESTGDYRLDLGTQTYYHAGNHIDLKPYFQAGGHGFFQATIEPCPGEVNIPFASPFVSTSEIILTEDQKVKLTKGMD